MWNSSIKLFYFSLFFLYSLLYSSNAICSNQKGGRPLVFDSSKVEVREPAADRQKKLLDNKEYQYDRVGPAPKSLWDRFWDWFWRKIGDIADSKGGSIGIRIFEYLLIGAAIVLIILLLLKNNVRALFYGKSAAVPIDFKEFEEDINKINFTELIEDALSKKDFRRAVRLHFLKLLKELADKNLIKWQIDKTNNDYFMELADSTFSGDFKELSFLYEYIWYGDFPVDEANFKNTISKFNDFKI